MRIGPVLGPLAIAGALALSAAPAAAAKCNPGTHTHGGVTSRTFCGPAKAHLTFGGKTHAITGGQCQKTGNYFTINIGTIVLTGNPPNRPDYFGITVGSVPGGGGKPAGKDGTYTGGAVAFVVGHKTHSLIGSTVTLTGNRTKGSFSGALFSGGSASGTFSCG